MSTIPVSFETLIASKAPAVKDFPPVRYKGVQFKVVALAAGEDCNMLLKKGRLLYCLAGDLLISDSKRNEKQIAQGDWYVVSGQHTFCVTSDATILLVDEIANKHDFRNPWKI